MKKKFILPFTLISFVFMQTTVAQINDPGQAVNNAATNQANSDINNGAQNSVNNATNSIKGLFKKKKKNPSTTNNQETNVSNTSTSNNTPVSTDVVSATPDIKTYQNYDFVPGDTVVFYDDFTEDQDGEFPSHWNLDAGQGVVNKVINDPAFFLTEGNYVKVSPLMKTESYLSNTFTIEFDYYAKQGDYGIICFLHSKDKDGNDQTSDVNFSANGEVSTGYFPKDFSANYPGNISDEAFSNKWHHGALIMKNNQLKCYVDQYRVLIMPNVGIVPTSVGFGGIGSQDQPIIFRNVRVANGGNMNMIGQKFTASKIVTHGITFDVDQSTIKPESMGALNMVAGVLKANPDLKFEIDGHTDNTGTPQHNAILSQQRADAVKAQLISMGIDASRLATKGFGDSKPIDTNDSASGRAENRRVEFVRM